MKDWKEYLIEDVAKVVGGGTPSSKVDEYWEGDIPWITPADLSGYDYKYISKGSRNISKKGLENSSAKLHPKNTLLLTSRAPIGYLAIAKNEVATNQGFQSLRCNPKKADYNFLYYYFQVYSEAIACVASGATFPEVSGKKVKKVKIKIPRITTQRKIASILSAYDDLIENNLKRIKLLEEKATLAFTEIFQDKNSNKWDSKNLGSLISFDIGGGWGQEEEKKGYEDSAFVIRGTDIDDIPTGKLENVPLRWHKKSNLKSRKLQHGDIVFEVSGGSSNSGVAKSLLVTHELLSQFDDEVMCASFCKLIRLEDSSYSHFVYLFLQYLRKEKLTEIYEKRSASNIVNYNWVAFLKYQKIKIPPTEILNKFNSETENIYRLIFNLSKQIQLLKEARDILLPRLMTGMIDVEELDLGDAMPNSEPTEIQSL